LISRQRSVLRYNSSRVSPGVVVADANSAAVKAVFLSSWGERRLVRR
jgi:hypothetical protein